MFFLYRLSLYNGRIELTSLGLPTSTLLIVPTMAYTKENFLVGQQTEHVGGNS